MSYNPIKPRGYLTTKGLVARFYKEIDEDEALAARSVAAMLDRGLSQVHGYTDEGAKSANMHLHSALLLTERTGIDVFARAFAIAAGGVFMPGAPSDESISELLAKEELEHGHLVAHIMQRLGRSDPLRLDDIVAEDLDRLIADLVQVRSKCAPTGAAA